jgi:TatD DNase family protein
VIDTHCHLDACDAPAAELVRRAREAGVERLATVGTNDASIERALAAAQEHEEVRAIVGRHPHETEGFGPRDLDAIERAAARPGSTTTATTPRETTSGARSRRRSTWRGRWICRS